MNSTETKTTGVKQGEVSRHPLDFYETPAWMTIAALVHVGVEGIVGECCVGGGAISRILRRIEAIEEVWTNDIDLAKDADYHIDATSVAAWERLPQADWIFTNPPYAKEASPIVKNAYVKARVGIVMLLRQSWDEVCDDRADFLAQHPPTLQISLPRYCFRRGKDGGWTTDSSPVWVFAWDKRIQSGETRKLYLAPEQISLFHRHPESECAPSEGDIDTAIAHLNSSEISNLHTGGNIATCESSSTIYLNRSEIRLDGGTQCRKAIDLKQVDHFVGLLEEGVALDPSKVVFDGQDLWLVDGFHRHLAYEKAGIDDIPVIIERGDSLADAQFAASAANKTNKSQLPRTRPDIRNAIALALAVRPEMSDRAIAEHVGCSHTLVSMVRRESEQGSGGNIATEVVRIGKDGIRQSRKRSGGSANAGGSARESEELLRSQHQQIMEQREELDRLRSQLSALEQSSAWEPDQFKDPEWKAEGGGQLTRQTVDEAEGIEPPDPDDHRENYEQVHAAWVRHRERAAIKERDEALKLVREQAIAIECLKQEITELKSPMPSDPFKAHDIFCQKYPEIGEYCRDQKFQLDQMTDERDFYLRIVQDNTKVTDEMTAEARKLIEERDSWKRRCKDSDEEVKRLRERISEILGSQINSQIKNQVA
jgi:hypothetical protein